MSARPTEVEIDYTQAMTDVASYFQRQRERARPGRPTLDLRADKRSLEPQDLRYPMPDLDPTRRRG